MLWDLGNKKRQQGRSPTLTIIVSKGEAPLHKPLHNKDRKHIENHKMKQEKKYDRNGSE